jgi:Raf kinase inhibitor-like YbhB/YbcL family protein
MLLAASLISGSAFIQNIILESLVLKPGRTMPKRYTAAGDNHSPPLQWTNLPSNALELALIFEDAEDTKVHWLLYNLPASVPGLREGLPDDEVLTEPEKISGSIQGLTDFKRPGYQGPNPPKGEKRSYRFTIYALNSRLGLQPGLDKPSLMALIRNHIVGIGELTVTCGK